MYTDLEIHILYDLRPMPDKWPDLAAEFRRQGVEPAKVWEPLPAKTVVESINISQKAIVWYAKERGLREICIWEDDCFFPAPDGWQYFLKNKPDDYDVYIAGTYLVDNPDSWQPPLIKVNEWVGNHCIIISERYYDRFLSVPDLAHIDTAQRGLGDFYVCFPMAAIQRPGYSSNAKDKVNYNSLLKPEWIYGTLHNI